MDTQPLPAYLQQAHQCAQVLQVVADASMESDSHPVFALVQLLPTLLQALQGQSGKELLVRLGGPCFACDAKCKPSLLLS